MRKRKEFQFSSARFLFSMTCFPVPFLFLQVIEGKLAPFLGKVIKFATSHVYSCSLCSQKGFICEICNNGEILYPFEDISTSRYRISCFINIYLNVPHAVLFGQIRPPSSEKLSFSRILYQISLIVGEHFFYPLVFYIYFQRTSLPLPRMR